MKKIRIALVAIAFIGIGYGYYLYNKPVANTSHLDAAYNLAADDLFDQFEQDEAAANAKYLGKIIQVKGVVKEFSIGEKGELNLILLSGSEMFGINCGLNSDQDKSYKSYQEGDTITVKGECTGISMDVVLVRCVIVN